MIANADLTCMTPRGLESDRKQPDKSARRAEHLRFGARM